MDCGWLRTVEEVRDGFGMIVGCLIVDWGRDRLGVIKGMGWEQLRIDCRWLRMFWGTVRRMGLGECGGN